jgi:hypothetical protein
MYVRIGLLVFMYGLLVFMYGLLVFMCTKQQTTQKNTPLHA